MPNGYTAALYEGDESFKNYVTRVAKDFGAYYHQRDGGLNEPLTKVDDSDILYYTKKVDEAQTAYDDFTALTEEEQMVKWRESLVTIREYNAKSNVRDTELAERYGRMLGKVIAWNVPEELKNLKDSMRKYLIESMDFDCGTGPVYQLPEPTFEKWLNETVDKMTRDMSYYANELERTKKRVAEQHAWHQMLTDALKDVE